MVATLLFSIVVAGLSIACVCTFIVPPIQFLFSTVAKALLMALGGA
jgi:hypothetical protein